MKKLLCAMLCFGLCFGLTGCGGDSKETDTNKPVQQEESDLDKVKKVFSLGTETTNNGSKLNIAKDGDKVKFKMYMSIAGDDKAMADAIGAKDNEIIYCVNGDDSETYLVNLNKVLVTFTDATAESMKENMDKYLSEKGLTLNQVKNALKEFK